MDKLRHVASLKTELVLRTRRVMIIGYKTCPEWVLQHKKYGHWFARKLKIRVPVKYHNPKPIEQLHHIENAVLKPQNGGGSNGVYLLAGSDEIIDVRQAETVAGWEGLKRRMAEDIATSRVPTGRWKAEELIRDQRNPAAASDDLKFFCFYGEIHRIGRIKGHPHPAELWTDGDLTALSTPKWQSKKSLDVLDVPPEDLEFVRALSLKIPAPFVRIDF